MRPNKERDEDKMYSLLPFSFNITLVRRRIFRTIFQEMRERERERERVM
jgi:hypothetical protein